MGVKVLIVDDDIKLQKLLIEYLQGYGLTLISLIEGRDTMKVIGRDSPDIVILDIMLPDLDGLDILKEIRSFSSTPVIMLTARGEDTDRIIGLELGADDYLPKPFNPRELLARIKAVLRRKPANTNRGPASITTNVGELVLDRGKQCIMKEGKAMELSATEFKILEALMERPNTVFSRDQLLNRARGRDSSLFDRSIDVHISRLRAKLESISVSQNTIRTVWGSGYMFVDRL